MFINRQSCAISDDENSIAIVDKDPTPVGVSNQKEKGIGLKSRLKKKNDGTTFLKGFALGFGQNNIGS